MDEMKNGISSWNGPKFYVGQELWTFYMEKTNAQTRLKYWTNVFKVRVKSVEKAKGYDFYYKKFEIIEIPKPLSTTLGYNIHNYLDRSCYFFKRQETAIEEHDKQIVRWAKSQSTDDRERMLKKLIVKAPIQKSQLEIASMAWYDTLTTREKEYVRWLKVYNDKI